MEWRLTNILIEVWSVRLKKKKGPASEEKVLQTGFNNNDESLRKLGKLSQHKKTKDLLILANKTLTGFWLGGKKSVFIA